MTFFDDVKEWHSLMNLRVDTPVLPGNDGELDIVWTGRIRLITEELAELSKAVSEYDITEISDALADLTFVVLGTAVEFDLPFNEIWNEIRKSNLTKVSNNPKIDRGGKVIKPENFIPPNLDPILKKKFNNETAGEHYHSWKHQNQKSDVCLTCGVVKLK